MQPGAMNIMNSNAIEDIDSEVRLEVCKDTTVGYKTIEVINDQVKGDRTPNKEEVRD